VVLTWVERVSERSGVLCHLASLPSSMHSASIHQTITDVHANVCLQYASLSPTPSHPTGILLCLPTCTVGQTSTAVCPFVSCLCTHTHASLPRSLTKKPARHHTHMGKTTNTSGTHRHTPEGKRTGQKKQRQRKHPNDDKKVRRPSVSRPTT